METAGKLVDNDELRDALKENGIGRPSTRAAIIETLFKRNYIRKQRKSLVPTQTGIELIANIQEGLLKSAELTGLWEKKLRQIERGTYEARVFLEELKEMVYQVVSGVLSATPNKKPSPTQPSPQEKPVCPVCKKGSILRGKTAYGCSAYKEGCTFRLDYATYGEGLSDAQLIEIIKGL